MTIQHIVKKPMITEKSLGRMAQNQYSFEVALDATKQSVAEAVAELFNVTVLQVKMLIRKGKAKRVTRKRHMTVTSKRKIAIVTIDPKDEIPMFSEFESEEGGSDKDKQT